MSIHSIEIETLPEKGRQIYINFFRETNDRDDDDDSEIQINLTQTGE